MKTIKNILIAAMALFAGSAMAQSLSADKVEIAEGATEAELVVNFESDVDVTGLQFTLTLPEGITVKKTGRAYAFSYPAESTDYNYKAPDFKVKDDGLIVIMQRYDSSCPALESPIGLISFTLSVAEGAKSGMATISDQVFTNKGTNYKGPFEAVQFAIQIGDDDPTTGINGLNAEESNEPAFNLAGQQVGKNYKGIVVKNGKKAIVK
ncbi:MAG: hypothetical protein J5658_00535 [Prevotella sp.]|nr:hypothetical protein [Prevotella sp.]